MSEASDSIADAALAEEKLLEELESLEVPADIREARLKTLKCEAAEFAAMHEKQHGQYTEIMTEKEFLDVTTSEERCVVHFYHTDFRRCSIMHTHLETLAPRHFETKFAKMNVEKAKFFVEKLKIRVLPVVICFENGIVIDRIVGFDDIGNSDDFQTEVLEQRLQTSGVIKGGKPEGRKECTILCHRSARTDDNDDDDDDDD